VYSFIECAQNKCLLGSVVFTGHEALSMTIDCNSEAVIHKCNESSPVAEKMQIDEKLMLADKLWHCSLAIVVAPSLLWLLVGVTACLHCLLILAIIVLFMLLLMIIVTFARAFRCRFSAT
jgi:hypothetical protein